VGVETFNSNSSKIDIVIITNNVYTHKQIEVKNNLVFMRIKKRLIELWKDASYVTWKLRGSSPRGVMMDKRLLAFILITVLVLNLVLFAIGAMPELGFWAIIILIAILAYKVIPRKV